MSNGTEPKEKKLAEGKLSATERAIKAKAEMESLFQEAINEQLAIIKDAEQKLGELGYQQEAKSATKKRARSPQSPDRECPICKFITDPPHDGRNKAHRDQGEKKKPLSDAQLAEQGLKKRS